VRRDNRGEPHLQMLTLWWSDECSVPAEKRMLVRRRPCGKSQVLRARYLATCEALL
jgi:hypothetical protein